MPLLFVHLPPLLLLVLAVFPRSHSVSKSPFVSCPLNPPSLIPFLPLGPNLALRLSSQSISRYLLCNITYSNIECKAISKKGCRDASLSCLFDVPSMLFLQSASPLSVSLSLSPSLWHSLYLSRLCCMRHVKQGLRCVFWTIIYLFSRSKRH